MEYYCKSRLIKRLLLLLFISLSFIGCDNMYVNHPISGKVYHKDLSTPGTYTHVYVYFYSNGRFDKYTYYSTFSSNYDKHFKWEIEGNKVLIYYDNSTYWKSSVRGTLLSIYTYDAKNNIIISDSNISYTFYRNL